MSKQKNPCTFRPWERKGENRNCINCAFVFYVPRAILKRRNGGKYCSRKCYFMAKKNGEIKNCLVCYKEFYTTPCQTEIGYGKYCSKQCRLPLTLEVRKRISEGHKGEKAYNWRGDNATRIERRRLMGQLEYKEWRTAVFKKDNYTCVFCKERGGEIQADHIKPWATHPKLRYDIKNGRTLCIDCHRQTPTWGQSWVSRRIYA